MMAKCNVIREEPVEPPVKGYVLELTPKEAELVRSVMHQVATPMSHFPAGGDVASALAKAGVKRPFDCEPVRKFTSIPVENQ